jgi:hypothetical protein
MLDGLLERAPSRKSLCRRFGFDAARPIVLYSLMALDMNLRYLAYRQTSDSEQARTHQRILQTLCAHPDVQVALKPHPDRGADGLRASPVEAMVRKGRFPNTRIVDGIGVGQLVRMPDVFVMDLFGTTLTQAATTDRPIYIYNPIYQWDEEALQLLRRRAFVSSDLEEFCRRIDDDLRSGRCLERQATDDGFLRAFAVPAKGRSTKACIDAISRLAGGAG